MRISHGRMAEARSIRQGDTFTGDVWADPVLTGVEGASVHNVFFTPRARTHWHRHDRGQILYVSAGSGRVASRDHGGTRIGTGDVVWIEPDEEHWHGADESSYLVHIAISLGDHAWLGPVTDDEYAAFGGGHERLP
jgi:quercetin dioxygenase-like cupin family protein